MTWFTGVVLEDNAVHSLPSYVCKPAPHLQQTKAVVAFSLIFWDLNMMKAQPWSFSWTGHDHLCASLALNCGTTFPDGHILCVLCSGIHYPTCFVTTRLSMSFHSHFPSSKFLGHVVGGPAQGSHSHFPSHPAPTLALLVLGETHPVLGAVLRLCIRWGRGPSLC